MKKHLLLLFLFCGFITTNILAQWSENNFNMPLLNVRDIEFVDENTGFIIGTNSNLKNSIVKTSNGGTTWAIKYNQVEYLEKLAIASSSVIYAIGFNASYDVVLAKSTNGGDTWTSNVLSIFENVRELQFLDANTGFFTDGDDLMKTSDGGVNWNMISVPQVAGGLYSFYFFNVNVGYLLTQNSDTYNMEIYKTINGGTSWSKQFTSTALTSIEYLNFFSEYVGVAYDSDEIYYTNNGGSTWQKALIPQYGGINEIKMVSSSVGFAADADYILKTVDGGANWNISKSYSAFGPVFPSVLAFPTSSTGYVAGVGSNYAKTSNSGGVGIEEVKDKFYQIYPNPTAENIIISVDPTVANHIKVDIFNMIGQRVLTKAIVSTSGQFDLNISNLNEGNYMIFISDGEKSSSSKITIIK